MAHEETTERTSERPEADATTAVSEAVAAPEDRSVVTPGIAADPHIVAAQLGRAPRAASTVASRCPLHLPVVIKVPPVLESGEPFPTRYWLCCPLAHRRIARLEAEGAVRTYEARRASDAAFSEALDAAHVAYPAERDALVPTGAPYKPRGGGAGVAQGVKCLHAHYAHASGGGDNPIGEETMARIEPLNCAEPCVVPTEDGAKRNKAWFEPTPV